MLHSFSDAFMNFNFFLHILGSVNTLVTFWKLKCFFIIYKTFLKCYLLSILHFHLSSFSFSDANFNYLAMFLSFLSMHHFY